MNKGKYSNCLFRKQKKNLFSYRKIQWLMVNSTYPAIVKKLKDAENDAALLLSPSLVEILSL
jgi:hypothetical protein